MPKMTWRPVLTVKVAGLDIAAIDVEYPDDDLPTLIQASNGVPIHTDRVLLALPEDRLRFAGDTAMHATMLPKPVSINLKEVEQALQLLSGHVRDAVSTLPAETEEKQERPWPTPPAPEAFYGLAGDIVRAIAPHTEADDVAILAQLLVAFGNAAGRGPHARVEASRHGLNEFVTLVGETAKARKGTSAAHVLHLFALVEAGRDAIRAATEGSWLQRCVKSGLASGEGLIWAIRDAITKQEPIKEKGQVTGYQTVITDEGVADKRLLVQEGEFVATLKVLSRETNTLSPALRNAWDSAPLRIMSKGSPAQASDPHVSVIGHITRDELCQGMAAVEGANGFANRFLWICVRRSKLLPEGGCLADATLWPLVQRLTRALDFASTAGILRRDPEATELWAMVYSALSEGREGMLGNVTARAEAHVLRLSCLYAVLDCSVIVRKDHLLAALALWQYAEDSAAYIWGDSTGNPTADAILQALEAAGKDGLTREDINSDVFKRNKPAATIQEALSQLLKANKAVREREMPASGKGRPVERYYLSACRTDPDGIEDTTGDA